MASSILVLGDSGTGKSAALRNLPSESTVLLCPNNKDLPFRGSSKLYNSELKNRFLVNKFTDVKTYLHRINEKHEIKVAVLEDLTHFFNARVMGDANIKGYDKWLDMAKDCFEAIVLFESQAREDLTLIVVAHVDKSMDTYGERQVGLKTPGKLLENNIDLPSYFSYILHTDVTANEKEVKYQFLTNRDGTGKLAKSPEGCFDLFIPNDYQFVINKINEYKNG